MEPEVSDRTSSASSVAEKSTGNITCETLDLPTYLGRYEGYTKYRRLLFIAEKCQNLRDDALKALISGLKTTGNIAMYIQACGLANEAKLGPEYSVVDAAWVDATEKECAVKIKKLEEDKHAALGSMVKESKRRSFKDLGDYYYDIGNLSDAVKFYTQARDQCSNHKQLCDINLSTASVALDQGLYRHVHASTNKLELSNFDVILQSKIHCVLGLYHMSEKKFATAAKSFFSVDKELQANFCTVLSPEDIALYGALCAVCSQSRYELKRALSENRNFSSFLELDPGVSVFVSNYVAGKFGDCLLFLNHIKAQLMLDVHISTSVDAIVTMITERIVKQSFTPYSTMCLQQLAASLYMQLEDLEKLVVNLIFSNQMPARINSETKTLHRKQLKERQVTLSHVKALSKKHACDIRSGIVRLSLMKCGLMVTSRENLGPTDHMGSLRSDADNFGGYEMGDSMDIGGYEEDDVEEREDTD